MKILKQKSVWNTTCAKWQCIDPGNIEIKEKRPNLFLKVWFLFVEH